MKTLQITYYTVEQKVFNSPEGLGVWGWMKFHNSADITDREQAEIILAESKERFCSYLAECKADASDDVIANHLKSLELNTEFRITKSVKTFTHASRYGYSDVYAYEIVRVVSDKTIEVRQLDATHDISSLKQHVGGFCAHVENQRNQKVSYASNPNAAVIRIRRKKNNPQQWTSSGSTFCLETEAYAFHDFNF